MSEPIGNAASSDLCEDCIPSMLDFMASGKQPGKFSKLQLLLHALLGSNLYHIYIIFGENYLEMGGDGHLLVGC